MSSVSRSLGLWSLVLCLAALPATQTAHAQATSGTTPLDRQLERLDLGINAMGSITKDVSGANYLGQQVDHNTSNTVGALVTFRYTKSPWIGAEFNIGYARYSHNYNIGANGQYLATTLPVQSNSFEYTLGYIAHPPHPIGGFQPFFGGGYGLLYFHPTSGGGEGLPSQGAGAGYYTVGVERTVLSPHFGVRVQMRELFYLSPDFYQNYLQPNRQTTTIEPGIGFYLHY